MELKNECVRDVLLTAEHMDLNEKLINESVFKSPRLQKHLRKDVIYTIKNIKEDTVWKRTKERAKKIGTSISLVALKTLASEEASKFYN